MAALPGLLADIFPDSAHVRAIGLRGADDRAIWAYAAAHGFVVVSKDDDFKELAVLQGAPPKLVMIALGNCATAEVESLLRGNVLALNRFAEDAVGWLIELP